MTDAGKPVINFVAEVKKRTGVVLDAAKIARGAPKRVTVDPQEDRVVRLAMDLLSVVRKSDASNNPVAVIAALQVVGDTISQETIRTLGQEQAEKAVAAASVISSQYQPEFPDDRVPRQVDADQEDDS